MSSQICAASRRSWVMKMTAVPSRACISAISCTMRAWIVTSSAVVGSSAITSRVETDKEYAQLTRDFELQLGKFDPTVLRSLQAAGEGADEARSRIEAMTGSSGFMLFGTTDHGAF